MNGKLLIGNDLVVTLTLTEKGVPVTAASVTMVLLDENGDQVDGQSWPASLFHEGNGVYVGNLQDTLDIQEAKRYYLHVNADAGGGKKFHQRVRMNGAYRE